VYAVPGSTSDDGKYTAIVRASDPRRAGGFSLSWQLLNTPANVSSLACGSTAAGALAPTAEYRYYLAGLKTNDIAKILLTPASGNFSPVVELYDPSGARVAGTANEIVQRVRADGNYLLVVSPSSANGETGTYSLAFQRPNNPCSTVALACGQSVLKQADVPGQIDAITFTGNAAAIPARRMPVRSGTFAPFAELYDASGTLLRGSSTGTLSIALPGNGNYTVFIRDRNNSGTGVYRAALQTDPACPVDDKQAPAI